MKLNRIALLAVAFLLVGCGLILSRALSGGDSPSTKQFVEATERGEMPSVESQRELVIANADGPLSLGAEQCRVVLKGAAGVEPAARLKSLAAARHVYLVVGDMSAAEQPGVPYQVFFDLPPGAREDANTPQYVGIITFFNAVRLEGSDPESKDGRFFSFDITEIVRGLKSKNILPETTTVTIKPGGVPAANSKARIGRLELIER